MTETTDRLEHLGRAAAQAIAGGSAVEQVQVEPGADHTGRPLYRFSFLIDHERTRTRPGLLRIRLGQRLRDELDALGDEHSLAIQILDREDWSKRASARTV